MKHENEFDELARQKLEGRNIPFEEGDWTAMQGLLKTGNSGRGGAFGRLAKWLGGAALLAILGVGVWKTSDRNTEEKGGSAVAATTVEHTTATEAPAITQPAKSEQPQGENASANSLTSQQEVDRTTAVTPDQHGPSVGTSPETEKPEALAIVASNSSPSNKAQFDHGTQGSTSPAERNNIPSPNSPSTTADGTSVNTDTNEPTLPVEVEGNRVNTGGTNEGTTIADVITDASETPGVSKGDEDGTDHMINETSATNAVQVGEMPSPEGIEIAATTAPDQPAKNESGTAAKNADTPNTTDGMDLATTTVPQGMPGDPEPFADPVNSATIPTRDTSSTEQEAHVEPTVNDTTAVAPEPLSITPLITARSPWQLSLLGGAMNNTTRYSGANSEEWNGGVQKQWTANAGLELVHMGRNFGIGTGVHYSTYSEQIDISAKDRNTLGLRNFWYLNPIDTTILFITDTIQQNGQTYYTGQSISTTVNVLTQGTDSTTTTARIRDARSIRNKVSYVEVPLLLDAHLVQGRWNFGVCGGPTVGLLTGRKGSLPNSNGEGYTALNDQPFREVVFGWTARAYVRYRFNAAWSIGVEPMVRGQLFNTLGSGDLSRKSTAHGGVLSLSYLLR